MVDGALYESWVGNRWFGNWLADDCLTYRLAEQFGTPVTTSAGARQGHVPEYQSLLGLRPRRVSRVHFEDLHFFRDLGHNTSKKARADQLRERLVRAAPPSARRGVFAARQLRDAEGPYQ